MTLAPDAEAAAKPTPVVVVTKPNGLHTSRHWLVLSACIAGLYLGIGLVATSAASDQQPSRDSSILPIDASSCDDMKSHHVMEAHAPVGCDRLRLIKFHYTDFEERQHADGEIVVMDAAAKHVLEIFNSLLRLHFPIAQARLMNRYNGDDGASMADNNTSAFNDREITGGGLPSLHAYGLAIDLNPVQNPFVTRNQATLTFTPPAGADYANRLNDRPWKAPRAGMAESVIGVFAQNGFLIWGGYWDNPIDYQHFQVSRKFAEQLASKSPKAAEAAFDALVMRYRRCIGTKTSGHDRASCIVASDSTPGEP